MAEHVLDRQSTHLYQVRKKVLEMMRDLDYVVADNELTLTNEQFCEKYREDPKQEDLMILKPKSSNNAEHGPKTGGKGRVGLKTIKTCKKRMKRENVPRAVFVVQQHITPLSKQYISRKAQKYHLEVFLEPEFLVNITECYLVPLHEILTPEEKNTLLERYTEGNPVMLVLLPWMQHNDPVARYYGINPGQVVKIIQSSETAGRYVTYRLFV